MPKYHPPLNITLKDWLHGRSFRSEVTRNIQKMKWWARKCGIKDGEGILFTNGSFTSAKMIFKWDGELMMVVSPTSDVYADRKRIMEATMELLYQCSMTGKAIGLFEKFFGVSVTKAA